MRLAPHNAAMKMLFLGGLRPPKPSRGWGDGETRLPPSPAGRRRGETRLPHTPAPAAYFHVRPYAVEGCGETRPVHVPRFPARGGRLILSAPGRALASGGPMRLRRATPSAPPPHGSVQGRAANPMPYGSKERSTILRNPRFQTIRGSPRSAARICRGIERRCGR